MTQRELLWLLWRWQSSNALFYMTVVLFKMQCFFFFLFSPQGQRSLFLVLPQLPLATLGVSVSFVTVSLSCCCLLIFYVFLAPSVQWVLSSSGGIVISISATPRELDKLEVHLLAGSPENVVREFRHKSTSLQGTQKRWGLATHYWQNRNSKELVEVNQMGTVFRGQHQRYSRLTSKTLCKVLKVLLCKENVGDRKSVV